MRFVVIWDEPELVRATANHDGIEKVIRLAREREARMRAYEVAWQAKWDKARAKAERRRKVHSIMKHREVV